MPKGASYPKFTCPNRYPPAKPGQVGGKGFTLKPYGSGGKKESGNGPY